MAKNFYSENKDIQFQVNEYIDWKPVVDLREAFYENPYNDDDVPPNYEEGLDTTKTIMEYVGHIVGDVVHPNAREIDESGGAKYNADKKEVILPEGIKAGLEMLAEAGAMGICIPRRYGGLNCGQISATVANELLSTGDASLMVTACLQWGVSNVISHFADEETKQEWLPKLASGEYGAAMVLTEAEAGSDLGALTTRADYDEANDKWTISGSKRFITNGQTEAHLVLARSEADTKGDVRGISLFLVHGKDAEVTRIEEKLGIHGSATCEVVYDKSPATLIGKRRFGLVKYMFALMNEARLAVAAQGVGNAQAAFDEALKYSDEREQFNTKIRNFPPVAKLLVDMKTEIEATRALVYKTAWYVDIYMGLDEHIDRIKAKMKEAEGEEKEKLKAERDKSVADSKKYRLFADTCTPLSKMKSGTMCVDVTSKAIQVLGGSGYTKEFNVERYFRDARIVDIYEGTGQLQVKAAISGVLNKNLHPIMDEIAGKVEASGDALLKGVLAQLSEGRKNMDEAIDHIRAKSSADDYEKYLNLYEGRLCQMLHELFSSYILLDHALISERKKYIVKQFGEESVSRIGMWKEQVVKGDLTVIDKFVDLTEGDFD